MFAGIVAAAVPAPRGTRAQMPACPAVNGERLLNARKDGGWLVYRRNLESTGETLSGTLHNNKQ